MVADGGRLPTASSPSGLRAFSSCHLPRCHGTSVLWATVHTLSVATPLVWPRPVGPWPPPTPGLSVGPGAGRAGGGGGGEAACDASSYNPRPLEAPPALDLKPSCCSLDPGPPSNLCSPPLPNARHAQCGNLRWRGPLGNWGGGHQARKLEAPWQGAFSQARHFLAWLVSKPRWCWGVGTQEGATPPEWGADGQGQSRGAASPTLDSAEPSSGPGPPFCREGAER